MVNKGEIFDLIFESIKKYQIIKNGIPIILDPVMFAKGGFPLLENQAISALKEFPSVNSSFDIEKGIHDIHSHVNLGIAVDLNQEGLLVGTIAEADSFNLKGLARKISETSRLLRDGKYGLEDVSGSTFTISNNGHLTLSSHHQ